ncbi:MAG: DinB family protein [Chitinophagaceae bacterium]
MSLSTAVSSRLQYQHESLQDLLKGYPETLLRQRPASGKWSPMEQVAHLAAYQLVFLQRLKLIEQGDGPIFERYVGDNDPVFLEYRALPLQQLLENLYTQRFIIINFLSTLPEAALRYTGRHPKYGEFTLAEWTEFFLLHEAHHLFNTFLLTRELASAQ